VHFNISRIAFPSATLIGLLLLCGCGGGSAANFTSTGNALASNSPTAVTLPASTGGASSSGSGSSPTGGSGFSGGSGGLSGTPSPTPNPTPPPTPTPTPNPTPAAPPTAPSVPGYEQVLTLPFQAGITHTDGRYGFTAGNYLVEGAQKILDLGSPAIFLYMTGNFRNYYPDRGAGMWPSTDPASLTELAQTSPFQKVFSMPFKTIVITAYGMVNGDNVAQMASDPNAAAAEEKEFYDFARYLYSTFAGTGKTFIIKHWEGDFIGLNGFDASKDISSDMVNAMVTWLKARQRGIARARQDAGNPQGIGVFHAVECSLVLDLARGQSKVRVINAVVPQVVPDMVTYSSWDSTMEGTDAASASEALNQALNTIKQYAPDPLNLGNRRILISEYGLYETNHPNDAVWREQAILSTAKSAGLLGAFFWELFDNECKNSSGNYFPAGSLPGDAQRPTNANCDGLSIVRPDGSTSPSLSVLATYWQ